MQLKWNSRIEKGTLEKNGLRLHFRAESAVVVANGQTEMLDRPVLVHRGQPVVPDSFLKFLSNYFATAPLPPPSVPSRVQTVIVDPGHGGHDTGAIGRMGLKEKEVNLDIARRLKNELESQGLRVIMTRKDDYFITLYHRTYIANRSDADFFVSIHCNASRNRDVDGFEIYHIPTSGESEDGADQVEANPGTPYYDSSAELAGNIVSAMGTHLPLPNRGVKSARFYVLKGVRMPAVLVEVGYISNPEEEASLDDKSYRQEIAEAVAEGIWTYKQTIESGREGIAEEHAAEESPDRDL